MIITVPSDTAYTNYLTPPAEAIARAQRHSKTRKAADRKTRLLDALFTTMTGHYPPQPDDLTHLTGNDTGRDPHDGPGPYGDKGPSGEDGPSGRGGGGSPRPNNPGGNGSHGAHIEGPEADSFEDDAEPLTDRIMADDDFTNGDTPRPSAEVLTPAPPAPHTVSEDDALLAFPERTRHIWDTCEADRGRETRLASKKLRKLLALRDGGCVFPTCTDPPEGCVAHHIISWESGGPTNLTNLALVCSRHHPRVEKPPGDPNSWTIIIDENGIPAARPPRRIDPDQHPVYHPRLTSPVVAIPKPGTPPGPDDHQLSTTAAADSVTAPAGTQPRGFTLANDWRFDENLNGPPPF
ncbi:HNH endonuclease signature motif containing protein [Bowdeniella massiliensis]|uniref:HNH endonuclease signature motif containing protein n=1 Tax=Bowdeniella massiliensis TaxID=2932264 RepID=UPI002027A2F6|nr:HNH endonuclease signature motif containing protein [Bowdeniella massiliensis]